jgi:hypothetical protein
VTPDISTESHNASDHGLDGPGIESWWGRGFSAPVQTGSGSHPASCTMGTGSFPGGKERPGRDTDPSPPYSSVVGHERVELYLYSPYGPYGLYRASVPVQVCTLFYLYLYNSSLLPYNYYEGMFCTFPVNNQLNK